MMRHMMLVVMVTAGGLAAGCLKRGEAIVVRPDGSMRLLAVIEGDPDDIRTGDPMPSRESGWQVTEEPTKDGDKDELRLTARRDVPAGAAAPSSYAPPGSALERMATSFPTTVRIDRRPEGTYYHFRRVYRARPAARIEFLRRMIVETDEIKELAEKNPDELTPDERQKYVAAMIEFERAKTGVFLDRAAESLGESLAPDRWLPARARAAARYDDKALLERSVAALADKEKVEAEVEAIEQQLLRDVETLVRSAMTESGATSDAVDAFLEAYRFARDSWAITEDLGDEEFNVVVQMPGRIIAHNVNREGTPPADEPPAPADAAPAGGDMIDLLLGGGNGEPAPDIAGWVIKGEELRDHDVVLLATSFVAR